MASKRTMTLAGALGVAALVITTGVPNASAGLEEDTAPTDARHYLQFTSAIDSFVPVEGGPAGPIADQFYLASHTTSGNFNGTTAASCVVTSVVNGGVRLCEVDFMSTRGIITARGITDLANTSVKLVVTGGLGTWHGATGYGTLTPFEGGSSVELYLR